MHDNQFLAAGKLPGELLERLLRTYKTRPDPAVIVDPSYGFDAAALRIGGETVLVKSDPITFATADAAQYLIAVNSNDIACLGGIPRWMTVVSLLPEGSTTAQFVEDQFRDLQQACDRAGISLIGGHTEITMGLDRPLLIGTLMGTIGPNGFLQPGKANAGDALWLSHTAGIEGTALLAHERENDFSTALGPEAVNSAKSLLDYPGISVSKDAQALLATGVVTAMHDPTEGGVATAIHEIAAASGLGAKVEEQAIPIHSSTRKISEHFGINPLGLLSSGALLLAARPGSEATLTSTGVPVAKIGILTDASDGITINTTEGSQPLPRFDADEITRALAN